MIFLIVIFTASSFAEFNPDTVVVRLATPRDAIEFHLKYLESDTYFPQKSAKALNTENIKHWKPSVLAVKLKKIMNARALDIKIMNISNDSNYVDSVDGVSRYYPFKQYKDLYLEKVGDKWKYSAETVGSIYETYHKLYPIDFRAYVDEMPVFLTTPITKNIELWQILGFLLLLLVGFIIKKLLSFVLDLIIRLIFRKTRFSDFMTKYLRPNLKTLAAIFSIYLIFEFIAPLEMPLKFNMVIDFVFRALIPVLFTIIIFRLTDYFAEAIQNKLYAKGNKVHENLLPFLRTTFKVIIIIIGLIIMLVNLGVDIITLLAGVSIGGIAIALAAQETIKNVFGSLTIFADRPFDVGDWIIYDGHEGIVESIGLRSTIIRTFNNSIITVPNGKLMDITIDNMGKREYRRIDTYLAITYSTPVEQMETFMEGIRQIILNNPNTRKDQCFVFFSEFADSSLRIYVRFWVITDEMETELQTRHDILFEILKLGRQINIVFAFPTQTVNIESIPENFINSL